MARTQAQREADKRYDQERKGKRHRVWMWITYPDSLPEDWRDGLSDMHMPFWVSPPHNQDVWSKSDERKNPVHVAGTLKKVHLHNMGEWSHPVTKEQVMDDIGWMHGTEVQFVRDKRSMMRYLAHLDDPKKAQYNPQEIEVFCGASLDMLDEIGKHERHEMLKQMRKFIREQGILYYDLFYDYCDDCMQSWSYLLDDSSYAIERYIGSMRKRVNDEKRDATLR